MRRLSLLCLFVFTGMWLYAGEELPPAPTSIPAKVSAQIIACLQEYRTFSNKSLDEMDEMIKTGCKNKDEFQSQWQSKCEAVRAKLTQQITKARELCKKQTTLANMGPIYGDWAIRESRQWRWIATEVYKYGMINSDIRENLEKLRDALYDFDRKFEVAKKYMDGATKAVEALVKFALDQPGTPGNEMDATPQPKVIKECLDYMIAQTPLIHKLAKILDSMDKEVTTFVKKMGEKKYVDKMGNAKDKIVLLPNSPVFAKHQKMWSEEMQKRLVAYGVSYAEYQTFTSGLLGKKLMQKLPTELQAIAYEGIDDAWDKRVGEMRKELRKKMEWRQAVDEIGKQEKVLEKDLKDIDNEMEELYGKTKKLRASFLDKHGKIHKREARLDEMRDKFNRDQAKMSEAEKSKREDELYKEMFDIADETDELDKLEKIFDDEFNNKLNKLEKEKKEIEAELVKLTKEKEAVKDKYSK